jgi:50S ribosomal subunit-associated GTPase HflX
MGAAEVPVLDVYNKIDTITKDEHRRILGRDPGAALIAARSGKGVAGLLRAVTARLALDTRRVTVTFDAGNDSDRRQIGRLYRTARVISHVATDGHVVIEADVPRRDVARLMHMSAAEGVADGM